MKIDKKLIKELVENLKEFELTELEYQDGSKISADQDFLLDIAKKHNTSGLSNALNNFGGFG